MAAGNYIENFRTEIKNNGVQVASHFEVTFASLPRGMAGTPSNLQERLKFRCESVSLPDVSINTVETHRFGLGPVDSVPYGLTYLEPSITFIADRNGDVYSFFYKWANLIMQMPEQSTMQGYIRGKNVYEVGFKSDVAVGEMIITAYDLQHEKIYEAYLFDVFPRAFFSTALNWAAGDELVRLTSFLTFKDFRIDFKKASTTQHQSVAVPRRGEAQPAVQLRTTP